MYTLVNKYGNREVKTESAIKRDHLLKEGFRLVNEVEEIAAPAAVSEPEPITSTDSKKDAEGDEKKAANHTDPDGEDDAAASTPPVSEPEDSGDEPKTVSVEGVAAPSEAPAAVSEPKTPKSNEGNGASETAKKTPTKE